MNKQMRSIAAMLLLLFAAVHTTYGWGNVGHMAVAGVAYNGLTAKVRKRVDALVQLNPKVHEWEQRIPAGTPASRKSMMLFMIAASWADQIKGDQQHVADGPDGGNRPPTDGTAGRNTGYGDSAMHKYWHFIDMPFSSDGTPLHQPYDPNARTQIALFRSVIASNAADPLKSYDLVWLLHLVGDIHQPLHCTSRFSSALPDGDAGGNSVQLSGIKLQGVGISNLHSYWDDLPGVGDRNRDYIKDVAAAMVLVPNLPAASASAAANLDVAAWVNESFDAAKSRAYAKLLSASNGTFTFNAAYKSLALSTARQRVALAGARLANILNKELK
ncbi:MAG: S1/P1 nuclease [Bacteroidetes bacterium]|nr:S1/P1 nuclease [Bacteroidota bacterium]